jgi:hypothetical protein
MEALRHSYSKAQEAGGPESPLPGARRAQLERTAAAYRRPFDHHLAGQQHPSSGPSECDRAAILPGNPARS